MKQKLFSIFCCLLLSASMVTQAQLLDALNESPLRDANLVDASLQVVSGEINLSDDNGEYYIIEKNGSRKAPAATVYALMKNSTLQYVNVQKTSTTNCFNVFIKTQNNYSGTTVTGFVIKNVNFGAADYIRGEHSFTSSYSNCTESDNWFVQNFSSASGGLYVDNPYGKIKFTYSSWGGDGYPIYRVQIYSCYGYTYNNGCINWKNSGAVFELDQYLSVHPFASDGSTRIDFTDYYKLTVVSESASKGSVSGDGSASGGQYYAAGSSHSNLTATPSSASYAFSKWQKNGADFSGNTANPLSITLNSNDTYTAIFNAVSTTYTISTAASPVNYGSASGGGTYAENTSATLTATPASLEYGFVKWQKNGADFAGNTVNPITVTVTAAATYTAVFEHLPQGVITVTANPTYGTATGSGSYERGTNVNISATPNSGYRFAQWSDGNTDNPRTITVTGNATYTAQFYDLNQPLLASFSWDDDNISVEQYADGNSLCNSYYSPYGKNFYLLYAKANSRSTKNYLNLSIQSTQSQMWGDLSFFKVGDYPVASSGLTTGTCNSGTYWFWTLSSTNVCVAYGYDSYALGLNPLGTYLCDKSGSAEDDSDQSNYISVTEGITCKITVGKNGDPYIRLVRNSDQQCMVSVGEAAVMHTVTINPATNGTITVKDGETIINSGDQVIEGTTLTVTTTSATGYHFDSWTNDGAASVTVNSDVTIGATFAINTYTVTIAKNEDGWGTVSQASVTDVPYGTTFTVNGSTITINGTPVTATPAASNAQYTYAFNNWTNALATVTGNMTVTANFTRTTNTYTITWQNADGTPLETDENVAYGATPAYNGATPTKTAAGYTYTFSGWSPTITTVTGNTTYTATFNAVAATTLDLYDNQDATYYNNIKALNGQTYDVTYHRSVKYESDNGNARWYTLCLPFDADQSQLTNAGLLRKVYEYRYATGSADEGDQVTFHFRVATSMVAGQGYLVKATGDMGPDFEFTGVTLDTDKDTESDVNDLKTNSANAYKESGDIAIVGVLRSGTLSNEDRKVMGLANNKIWYPHSSGNPMPAYRAYFYNPNASASVMPRVRIEVEGEGTTELEVVDGELISATEDSCAPSKYIRNGVLIIERNGVRYDAQGKRM